MKHRDLVSKFRDILLQCLGTVPSVRNLTCTLGETDYQPDFLIEVATDHGIYRLLVVIRNNGQPRYARDAVAQLLVQTDRSSENTYPIFAAPFISKSAAEICIQAGIGYIDLAGNCRLAFNGIYVEREGSPNQFVSRRLLRSLYQARSSRVLRALLFDPNLKWKLTDLSTAAGVSIGQVFNVKKALIDREWAVFDKDGLQLTQPEPLLRDWGEQYSYTKNTLFIGYSLDTPSEIESKLARYLTEVELRYALTSFSASAHLMPDTQHTHVFSYVDANINSDIDQAVEYLKLKPIDPGVKVTLMLPYDQGVFFGMKEIEGMNMVSPIQAYLDLVGSEGEGVDAAETLFRQVIQKEWQKDSTPTGDN